MWMNKMMKWELRDRFVHRSLGLGFFPHDSAAHQGSKSGGVRLSTEIPKIYPGTSGAFLGWVGCSSLKIFPPRKVVHMCRKPCLKEVQNHQNLVEWNNISPSWVSQSLATFGGGEVALI